MNFLLRIIKWQQGLLMVVAVLSTGLFVFKPLLALVQFSLGVSVWMLLSDFPQKRQPKMLSALSYRLVLAPLMFLFVLVHLYPFLLSSAPFGFDTGMYRYEFFSAFQALPEYASRLFLGLPLLSDVGLLFGTSLDQVLNGLYALQILLLFACCAFVVERWWGKEASVFAAFLLLFSVVQWQAYEMMLFKQLLGMNFVLFGLWLFSQRSFLVVLPLMFLGLLQPLDAFFLVLSMSLYAGYHIYWARTESRFVMGFLLLLVTFGLTLLIFEPVAWSHYWAVFSSAVFGEGASSASIQQGVFLALVEYGYQSALLFVFGLLGWFQHLREKKGGVLSLYFFLLLLWVAAGLFFYQRVLITFDFFLILYASAFFSGCCGFFWKDSWGKGFVVLLLVGFSIPFFLRLWSFEPDLSQVELSDITSFCQELPDQTYVMATDSRYAPWLRGYCLQQRVIAPGLFEFDLWIQEEWEQFWADTSAPALMARYQEDVYLYIGKNQPRLDVDPQLFEVINANWSLFQFSSSP